MRPGMTHVSITGGQGFLGRNLAARLAGLPDCALTVLCREDEPASCASSILQADLIFHLAGASRTEDPLGFGETISTSPRSSARFSRNTAGFPGSSSVHPFRRR
jgi:nucleoside-diphosphate-sugar epimerase